MKGSYFNAPVPDTLAEGAPEASCFPLESEANFSTGLPTADELPPLPFEGHFGELLGTHFLICTEKIAGRGEDCGIEIYTDETGLMGVFDGCGGLGARVCTKANGKTEAYLASRAIGSAAGQWFFEDSNCAEYDWNVSMLRQKIETNLQLCRSAAGDDSRNKIKGSMARSFPSTVALVTFYMSGDMLISKHIWAGDSRTYILDRNGLSQVSTDDINGQDAMSNLSSDGALTNVVAADANFSLHCENVVVRHPSIVVCATDGCFGYVSSPMEFESMLLSTLSKADNVMAWKAALKEEIASISGDDQTIAIAALGFETFDKMRHYYEKRAKAVRSLIEDSKFGDADGRQELWNQYNVHYYRYQNQRDGKDADRQL